jgi:hypothetical protein
MSGVVVQENKNTENRSRDVYANFTNYLFLFSVPLFREDIGTVSLGTVNISGQHKFTAAY